MKINDKNLKQIKKLCKQYKVRTFSAFGSVTRDDFSDASDIDFVMDFDKNDPFEYTNLYFQLKDKFEKLLNVKLTLLNTELLKTNISEKNLMKLKF